MEKYMKDESYPTINAENSTKTVDIIYVDIDRELPSKTLESGKSFFRVDSKFAPTKFDSSDKILPDSHPNKIIDENHEKEQGKDNDDKIKNKRETENQNQNEDKQPKD